MPVSVSLFATCIVDALYPTLGEAVVDVLEKLGHEVSVPAGQTCCGLPLYNNGYVDEAKKAATHTIEVMRGDNPVVVPSGSCGWMLRKIYPQLIDSDAGHAFAARVKEFSEFVSAEGAQFRLRDNATAPRKVTYHPSCHLLRGLHVSEPPRALLGATAPLEVVPLEQAEECCGFGGTFATRYDQISSAMLTDKLTYTEKTGADTLVVTDPGCLLHLDGGARQRGCPFRVRHLAEVLAEADVEKPPA